jgi:NarL family two-component system response regulator LiaR
MKVLIVDDDPLVSRSLRILLAKERDMQVLGAASNGAQAVVACERAVPDVVLMDIRMPGVDGIEATRRIKARWPAVRVVMLTTFDDEPSVRAGLEAGADGYLLKSASVSGMAERLRALAAGSAVLDSGVLKRLTDGGPRPFEGLTLREGEVAELVAQGCSNREVAARLFISEGTVRNVLSVVLEKLGLRDRTQLAIRYWKRG